MAYLCLSMFDVIHSHPNRSQSISLPIFFVYVVGASGDVELHVRTVYTDGGNQDAETHHGALGVVYEEFASTYNIIHLHVWTDGWCQIIIPCSGHLTLMHIRLSPISHFHRCHCPVPYTTSFSIPTALVVQLNATGA